MSENSLRLKLDRMGWVRSGERLVASSHCRSARGIERAPQLTPAHHTGAAVFHPETRLELTGLVRVTWTRVRFRVRRALGAL